MPSYTVTTEVAAPPERVFAAFTDYAHIAEHVSAIQRVELLTEGPVGVGTRFRETRTMFGREATETMEVTAFDPPRSFTLEANSCGAHWSMVHRFQPERGGTHVTLEMTLRPVSFLAKVMSPLSRLMAGSMLKCIQQDFDDMKCAIEGEGAAVQSPAM
jgi:uncharacterized protein YndB with AHSA1/START domain